VDFKFKFELCLNFRISALIATCKGASNFQIWVSQSKFTVLKIMLRKIFGEFMKFYFKCLNLFKIQTKFKCSWLPEFLVPIMLEIWTCPQKECCYFWIGLPPARVLKCLEKRKCNFCIFKLELVEILKKNNWFWFWAWPSWIVLGWAPRLEPAHGHLANGHGA
jgi:hypothetical protein